MAKLTKAGPVPGLKMAAGTLHPGTQGEGRGSKAQLAIGGATHSSSSGAGVTASQYPVPAVPGALSRWRKMQAEVGRRWEQRIAGELRPRGLGLGFASDAAGPP